MAEGNFFENADPNTDLISQISNVLKQDAITNNPSGTSPFNDINTNIAGDFETGPLAGLNPPKLDFLQSVGSALKSAESWAQDPNQYGRSVDYAAGLTGFKFDRYYASPAFSKLGFNPGLDMETYYNENTSWWDDFVRGGSAFGSLVLTGFKSPFDFGSESSAKEMQKQMDIASSTRGGLGGFFTNFIANAGYSVGIGLELIAENYLIAAITASTGGLAAIPAALAGAARTGMVTKKLYDLQKGVKSTLQLMDKLKPVNEAAQFYKTAKASTGLGNAVFDFLNPISRSTDYLSNLKTGANGFREMNNFVKTRKAFGAFYRDLREINMVFNESLMEGNIARNKDNIDSINDFYEKNNRMPSPEEAKGIKEKAENIGFATSLYNVPIIFFSNRLVFDNLFRGFKPPSMVGEELINGSQRQLIKKEGWKAGQDAYGFLEANAKQQFRNFITKSPYLPWSKKYIVGNLAEGIQEVSQESISSAADLYYNSIYDDPAAAGFYGVATNVGTALNEQFSVKGLETFLSGFLTGSVVQGVGAAIHSPMLAPALYKKYMNSEQYKEMRESVVKTENLVADAANNLLTDPYNNFVELTENALRQNFLANKMKNAQYNNDQLSYQDAKVEMKLEHLHTLAQTGKMDLVFEKLDDMLSLQDNDLADAYNVKASEASAVRQRITDLKQDALEYQNRYDAYTEMFSNPFKPQMIDRSKQRAEYNLELQNKTAYDLAVKDLIMVDSLVKSNAQRMESMLNDFTKNDIVRDASATDFSVLLSNQLLIREIETLKNEVGVLEAGTPEQKKIAREKQLKLEALMDFQNGVQDWSAEYKRNRKLLIQKEKVGKGFVPRTIVIDKKTDEMYEIIDYFQGDKTMRVLDENEEVVEVPVSNVIPITKSKISESRLARSNNRLYEQFLNYLNTLATINKTKILNDKNIKEGYSKLRDHLTLQNEQPYLFQALNTLNNPESLMTYARRKSEEIKVKQENFKEYIRSGYRKLAKVYKDNIFLNNLYSRKATIDPEDAEKIIKRGDFTNVTIYDAETASPISKDDPRWNDIQTFIDQYKKAVEEDVNTVKKKIVEKEEGEEKEEIKGYSADLKAKLLELVKKENVQRKKLKETLLPEDIENEKTKKWLSQSEDAQELIEEEIKTRGKKTAIIPKLSHTDWTPPPVPKGLDDLKDLFKKLWVVDSTGKFYISEDYLKGKRTDNKAYRVSSLKINPKFAKVLVEIGEMSGERGSTIDDLIRAFVENEFKVEFVKNKPTKETLDAIKMRIANYSKKNKTKVIFEEQTYSDMAYVLDEIKTLMTDYDLTFYSTIPPVVAKLGNTLYGGTIDLLAKNNKTGEYFIVDIKTNRPEYSRRGKTPRAKQYKMNDAIQLNAYAEIIKKVTGVEISGLYVLPIIVEHGKGPSYKKIKGMELDQDLNKDDLERILLPVSMKKSIYALDQDAGTKDRERTLSTNKKTRKEIKEEEELKFTAEQKQELRKYGFVSTVNQKEKIDDEKSIVTGMTYYGLTGRVTIDIVDDEVKVTSANWLNDDRTAIDEDTLDESKTDNLDEAVQIALEYFTIQGTDLNYKEEKANRERFFIKVNNLASEEDFNKFKAYIMGQIGGKNSSKWLKDNGLTSIMVNEAFDKKESELGLKPQKKPKKDSDTKKKSNTAMNRVEEEDKKFIEKADAAAKSKSIPDADNDFLDSIC